jgi:hypothetical protein
VALPRDRVGERSQTGSALLAGACASIMPAFGDFRAAGAISIKTFLGYNIRRIHLKPGCPAMFDR